MKPCFNGKLLAAGDFAACHIVAVPPQQ